MSLQVFSYATAPVRFMSTRALATVFVRHASTFRHPSSRPQTLHYRPSPAFSTSAPLRASETNDQYAEFVDKFRQSPAMTKIANSKEAMDALREMAKIMQEAGFDFQSKPSMITMMKLTSSPGFRAAASKVMEEFKKAGVEINRETAMEMMSGFPKSK